MACGATTKNTMHTKDHAFVAFVAFVVASARPEPSRGAAT
jgi:hypothetical protein